ncbi:MAG: hypothetical protein HYX75_23100 [Acidobacteria bacterium]|nr:hypothetical protein [Acidobacteriota bacterium]
MRGLRGGSSARCIMLVGLSWSSSIWCCAEPATAAKRPIAIVAYVSGTAECLPRGVVAPRAVGLFDLLTEGTELRTDAGSTVRLAFASGSLYELAESGRALVAPDGFASCRGSCRLVSRSTATDLLSVILSKNGHTTAAAIRIRGSCLSDLVSLPDPVIVRLAPWIEAGAHQRWQLAIVDQEMRDVFATDVTSSADVTIPAGILRAGVEYVWSLHAIDDGTRTAIVEQKSLRILGTLEARLRKGMRSSYDETKEVSWLLLLAGWDADAGLVCGACGELREALRQTGENAPIREKLTELGCRE